MTSVGELPASKPGSRRACRSPISSASGMRSRSASASSMAPDGQHARRAGGDRVRRDRERAKHVDDDRDAARGGGAGDVIDDLDPQARASHGALSATTLARGMKLKSVALAQV